MVAVQVQAELQGMKSDWPQTHDILAKELPQIMNVKAAVNDLFDQSCHSLDATRVMFGKSTTIQCLHYCSTSDSSVLELINHRLLMQEDGIPLVTPLKRSGPAPTRGIYLSGHAATDITAII